MALSTPIWMQNGSYPAGTDRQLIGATLHEGVLEPGDLKVSAGGGLSVDVAAGTAVVAGGDQINQGSYLCSSTTSTSVDLDAAPGTGQSRIDAIVAEVRDSQVIGGGDDDWQLVAITGTPAVDPSPPSPPASSAVLAWVHVGPNVTTVGQITDRRSLARQAGEASALPPTGRPGQILQIGNRTYIRTEGGEWGRLARRDLFETVWLPLPDVTAPGFYAAWGERMQIANPHRPVRVTATLTGQATNVPDQAPGFLFHKIQMSLDGNATLDFSPEIAVLGGSAVATSRPSPATRPGRSRSRRPLEREASRCGPSTATSSPTCSRSDDPPLAVGARHTRRRPPR